MGSWLWQAHIREERLFPVVGAASRSPPLPFGSGLASNARWVQSALRLEKKWQGISKQLDASEAILSMEETARDLALAVLLCSFTLI